MDTIAPQKFIMDLEMLNTGNEKGCIACGKKFSLGDTVVMACGAWEGAAKMIHENEAIFDKKTGRYIERKCYAAGLIATDGHIHRPGAHQCGAARRRAARRIAIFDGVMHRAGGRGVAAA